MIFFYIFIVFSVNLGDYNKLFNTFMINNKLYYLWRIIMNKSDLKRDYFMLKGPLAKKGYDWWWHSLTAYNKKTGEPKPFFFS